MNTKFLLSGIIAGVVMWLLAGAWHMALMGDFYAGGAGYLKTLMANPDMPLGRENPMIWMIGVAYLLLGLLMAYVYPKGTEGGTPMMEGLKFGAIIGIIWVLPHSLVMYAVTGLMNKTVLLVDAAWHVVEEGIGGVLIAYIYGAAATMRPPVTSSSAKATNGNPQATQKKQTTTP